jgi:hypothetical protein
VNPDDETHRAIDRPYPRNAFRPVGGWAGGIVLGNLDQALGAASPGGMSDIKARIGQEGQLHVFALPT